MFVPSGKQALQEERDLERSKDISDAGFSSLELPTVQLLGERCREVTSEGAEGGLGGCDRGPACVAGFWAENLGPGPY